VLLDIEEALVSLTRAALAQRHALLMPDDPVAALLVAQTAAEYTEPLRTEALERPRPIVHVMLSEDSDETLAGFGHVRLWPPGPQRLSEDALNALRPSVAVIIGGAAESFQDFEVLRPTMAVAVIGTALAEPLLALREYDVVGPMLRDIEWREGEPEAIPDAERSIPYPYLMQALIAELGGD
jgi:hypothetical protein